MCIRDSLSRLWAQLKDVPGARLVGLTPSKWPRVLVRVSSSEGASPSQTRGTEMLSGSLTVGTDGACLGNPGPSGWAWVDEHGSYHSSGQANGTNNIAELRAVLDALNDHTDVCLLYTSDAADDLTRVDLGG